MRIVDQRPRESLVGERQHERPRGIVERRQVVSRLGIGLQMQIGEDTLAAAPPARMQAALSPSRSVRRAEYLIRTCGDLGAGGDVLLVGNAGPGTRHGLDHDPMPPRCQFLDRRGRMFRSNYGAGAKTSFILPALA